ncbi:hypothetical protein MMC12_003565 [Toensbergia leucococca]|nr:hypothetical protein [Toensbergia leucococca]
MLSTFVTVLLALTGNATASIHHKNFSPPRFTHAQASSELGTNASVFAPNLTTFQQLLDHDNPDLGTLSQRVVFFTPGEQDASIYTGFLSNATIAGAYAQAIGGAVVMMEHRYFGESSPFENLTAKNLQYLTLRQSIADTTYLAKYLALPFDPTNKSQACTAPWVFSGCSYSGALSAWTASTDPGTFWAYASTSAPVEAIYDFWQYYVPVRQGMPANCSKDVSRVVRHVDHVLERGNQAEKTALKGSFGFDALEDDDFAYVLAFGPLSWQNNDFFSGYSDFFQFCDSVENAVPNGNSSNSNITIPGENGVGLEKALVGYASWLNSSPSVIPNCDLYCTDPLQPLLIHTDCEGFGYNGTYNLECLDTHNPANILFTDYSVGNIASRQWQWLLCNEFAWWEDGAPLGTTTIVSRLVSAAYWQRQCALYFPPEDGYTYGSAKGETVNDTNAYTGGWKITNTTRLIWTNGQYDPFREASVSSSYRPRGPLASTAQAPLQVIPGGYHCSDLRLANAAANAGVQLVVDNEVQQIKEWVDEHFGKNSK